MKTSNSIIIALLGIIAILLAYFVWSVTSDYRQIKKNTEDTAFFTQKVYEMFADRDIVEMQAQPFIPYK